MRRTVKERSFKERAARHRLIITHVLGFAVLAAMVALQAPSARAGDEQLAKAGAANRPLLIREHAAWNRDCKAVPYPVVRLERPPQHGAVCARVGNVTIKYMYAGTEAQCVGHVVQGLQLIYFPRAGFTGHDRLRYSVQYPSVRRSVSVTVSVGAGALSADTVGAVPDLGPASSDQAPGPVPPCAASMS